jgi:hypothetical protein
MDPFSDKGLEGMLDEDEEDDDDDGDGRGRGSKGMADLKSDKSR